MPEMTIRNLDEDHKHCEVAEKCYQGLLKWKENLGPQGATIEKLCRAMQNVGCSEALEALQSMLHQNGAENEMQLSRDAVTEKC